MGRTGWNRGMSGRVITIGLEITEYIRMYTVIIIVCIDERNR